MPDYDMGTAHGRIRIDYEGDGFRQSEEGFERVRQSASDAGGGVNETIQTLGKMVTMASLFGGAIAQMGAAGVAAAGTMAAAFASAGAAMGAFGAAVKPQFAAISDVAKLYEEASAAVESGAKNAKDKVKAYKDALAELPPATRETATAFIGLKGDFKKWSDSLSSTTMPLFTRGINLLRKLLPSLTPLVKAAAGALSTFLGDLENDVQGGGIQSFIKELASAATETLPAFLRSAKNIVVGIGGIIKAFLPFSTTLTGGMEGLTEKFATWGQSLGGSSGFQSFIDNMKEQGPVILEILKNLAIVLGNSAQALGPLSGGTVLLTAKFAALVAQLPVPVLRTLAIVIGVATIATKAYTTATSIATGVAAAFGTAAEPGPLRRLWSALTTTTAALKTFTLWVARGTANLLRMAATGIKNAVVAMGRLAASAARAAASMAIVAARAAASGLASLASTIAAAAVQYGAMAIAALRSAAAQALLTARLIAQKVLMLAIRTATLAWTAAQWLLNTALLANPIGLIVLAIIALIAIFILAWKNSDKFREIVTKAFNAVKDGIMKAVNFIVDFVKSHWKLLLAIIAGPLGIIVYLVIKYWSQIKGAFTAATNFVVGVVRRFVSNVLAGIRSVGNIVGTIAGIFNRFNQAIFSRISSAARAIAGFPGRVIGFFRNAGSWLFNAGRNIIQGLINGIWAAFGRLRDALGTVTNLIPSWKGPPKKDAKLLTKNGELIMKGLIAGFQNYLPEVKAALTMVSNNLVTAGPGLPTTQYLPNGRPYTPQGQTAVTNKIGNTELEQIATQMANALAKAGVGQVVLDGQVISSVVGRIQGRATNNQRRTR